MPSLTTDDQGFIRFAAISDTWLGSRTARPHDLDWFYRSLPGLGVSLVLHLGGAVGPTTHDLDYPLVEGVTTLECANTLTPLAEPRLRAKGRSDVHLTDNFLQLIHGAHRGSRTLPGDGVYARLLLLYDPNANLKARIRDAEVSARLGRVPSAITLVGGSRKVRCRYYNHERSFIGTVGCFAASPHYRTPPPPYGGTIVEVKLNPDASLDTCVLRFRDMSGGMPDVVKEVTHGAVAA